MLILIGHPFIPIVIQQGPDVFNIASADVPYGSRSIPVELYPLTDNITAKEDMYYRVHYGNSGVNNVTEWTFETNSSWLRWDDEKQDIYGTPGNADVGSCWVRINITDREDSLKDAFTLHEDILDTVLTGEDVTDVNATFVADPFMISESGLWYMFFEVMVEGGHGDIGLATSADGVNWDYDRIVLDESYHLSFPYVFKWEGDFYMLPQQSGYRSQQRLYRTNASDFPYNWTYVSTILDSPGQSFVDSTILRYGDIWWLFASEGSTRQNTRLYYNTGNLTDTSWTEHPKSPVVSEDRRRSRIGGRPIIQGDSIILYKQKCDISYGESILAFRVETLTLTDYSEKEMDNNPVITKSGSGWNSTGMHHIDPWWTGDRWLACVDGMDQGIWSISIYATSRYKENYDEHNFTIIVANSPPVIEDQPPLEAEEDEPFLLDMNCDDEGDGDTRWAFSGEWPEWIDIDPVTGILNGTPSNDDVGAETIWISFEDGNGGRDDINITLTVNNVNDAPVLTIFDTYTAVEDQLFYLELTAEDVDAGDLLLWSMNTTADWLSLNSTEGSITGTPDNGDVGVVRVAVRVEDGEIYAEGSFLLTVENVNDIPEWRSVPSDRVMIEGDTFVFSLSAVDIDGDPIVYSITSDPQTDIGFLRDNSTLIWKSASVGFYTMVLSASDGALTINHLFNIKVLDVNHNNSPPSIYSVLDITITSGKTVSLEFRAHDEDGDTLIFSLRDPPDGMVISAEGELVWTPNNDQVGVHRITLDVSDMVVSSLLIFNITVIIPQVEDVNIDENNTDDDDDFVSKEGKDENDLIFYLIIITMIIVIISLLWVVFSRRSRDDKEE